MKYLGPFRWSSQNLTDGRLPLWRNGRAWLWTPRPTFRAEWSIRDSEVSFSVSVKLGGEDDLLLGIRLPWFALYLGVERLVPYRWLPRRAARKIGLTIYHEHIWLDLWANEWGDRAPRHLSLDWKRLLMGRQSYAKTDLSTHAVVIPMPEADYPATVTLEECVWSRARWPGEDRRRFASVSMESPAHGVPVPGKGENSWDCGDDCIWGLSVEADSVQAAVWAMVESAMRTRKRYGGNYDWLPRPAERVRA